MIKVNIFQIKAKLSEYIDKARRGDSVVIYRHNQPVAELRGLEGFRTEPRPIGPIPGRPAFKVPGSFFDPLPDEEMALWNGLQAPAGKSAKRSGKRR